MRKCSSSVPGLHRQWPPESSFEPLGPGHIYPFAPVCPSSGVMTWGRGWRIMELSWVVELGASGEQLSGP